MSDRHDQAAQPLRFESHDGLTLVGEGWGDPQAPPVVLLHGGGQTRHAWSGTARTLSRRGWYAIALDQRGHGESDWSPEGVYGFEAYAEDVRAVCKQLQAPPVLVGASLGGVASLFATHLGQHLAAALVMVDVGTRMEVKGVERIVDFMAAQPNGFATLEEAADAVAAYNPHRKRPKDLKGLEKNLRLGDDGRWRWHWDPKFLEGRRPPAEPPRAPSTLIDDAAHGVSIPTLLVRGRMSDILSEEGAQVFLRQVPHAHYADISGAGHMVAGDRNDIFSQAVLDFLADELPAPGADESARRVAPATARNREPLLAVLRRTLPSEGFVLELASGSGEHALHFAEALPELSFQPSDPDAAARRSIVAWQREARLPNLRAPIALDAEATDWRLGDLAERLRAIVCVNMIHISPWSACLGLLAGAGRHLRRGDPLVLYGPYRRAGHATAPSNEDFDRSLRERDARWGLRQLEEVEAAAREQALRLDEVIEMPANNLTVVFRKS